MDIINREYPPGVFSKGSQIFGQKIRGLKFLEENLRGLKSISMFGQNVFKIFSFLEVIDPNIAKIVTISEKRKTDKPNFWLKQGVSNLYGKK